MVDNKIATILEGHLKVFKFHGASPLWAGPSLRFTNLTATMSDPVAATTVAAATAAAATVQQTPGVAGRQKMPTIEKARLKQMLDEPEVQQDLAKLVAGNASALQAIIGILKAMASSTDINADPQMVELLKTHQVGVAFPRLHWLGCNADREGCLGRLKALLPFNIPD